MCGGRNKHTLSDSAFLFTKPECSGKAAFTLRAKFWLLGTVGFIYFGPAVNGCAIAGDRSRGNHRPQCGRTVGDDLPVPVPQSQTEARSSTQTQTQPQEGPRIRTGYAHKLATQNKDFNTSENTRVHLVTDSVICFSHCVWTLDTLRGNKQL